ncbi:MAG: hypothetical protein AABX51_05000 [Nanoarchaeota archaeon]
MVVQETVTRSNGLVIRSNSDSNGYGYVNILSGNNPEETWKSIIENSAPIPKNKFIDSHAVNLWWLRTESGYEGVKDGFFERQLGTHFGTTDYRTAEKTESIQQTSRGIEGQLRYEILLSSSPVIFGKVDFPTRHMSIDGKFRPEALEEVVKKFIKGETTELRNDLPTDYAIFTFFEPWTGGCVLDTSVSFGIGPLDVIGPTKVSAENLDKRLVSKVMGTLDAFQRLPYQT